MEAAPNSHTPKSTARPSCWVAQEARDAANPLKKPASGITKFTEVATQIQYFQVALAPRVDVRAQAPGQRIEG
jgi:hypothetical protein